MIRALPAMLPVNGRLVTAEAPIAAWLTIGPNSRASIVVSFPGTTKSFSLTHLQAQALYDALGRATRIVGADDGERQRSVAVNLMRAD